MCLLTFLILSLNRGDSITVQSDNIMASAWLDRKVVTMMATGCDATEVGMVLCRQKDGSRKEVSTPTTFIQYNKYMGGVDLGDQLRGYYQSRFKVGNFTNTLPIFYLELQ